jgi:hypothetical protein
MFAAFFIGVLGAGAMLAPAITSARPGGLSAGPAMPMPGVMHPAPVRPPAVRAPIMPSPAMHAPIAHPSIVRPAVPRPIPSPAMMARTHMHPDRTRLIHRQFLGLGWPVAGGWPAGAYYEPTGTVTPYEQVTYPYSAGSLPAASYPATNYPDMRLIMERILRVMTYRPGCNSQTETVPWRDGSDHAVTIVRC